MTSQKPKQNLSPQTTRQGTLLGLVLGGLSFTIWGLLPLYWRLVQALSPYQVFAHRVVWSFFFLLPILYYRREARAFFGLLRSPMAWLKIMPLAIFISVNWLTYIYSVTQGYVVEASLGYYINPLVLTAFGMVFFREKLTFYQAIGILLAAVGVVIKTLAYGQVPWIALILAISFASYGLLKKLSPLNSTMGLTFETLVVGIPALLYLFWMEGAGQGIVGNLPLYFWLLIGVSGIATATPLLLYGEGTKRLPLKYMGILQYISPSISLVLGITVFKEAFPLESLIAFSFIWLGIFIFSISGIVTSNQK